jgi:hypothetical protein
MHLSARFGAEAPGKETLQPLTKTATANMINCSGKQTVSISEFNKIWDVS